jgi:hypothetical protein
VTDSLPSKEQFRSVEPLKKPEFHLRNCHNNANGIHIQGGQAWSAWTMNVATARELRDWLNAALPALEPPASQRPAKPRDLQSLCDRLAEVFNTDDTPEELSQEAREAIEDVWQQRDCWMQWAQHLAACTDCHVGDCCRDGVALRVAAEAIDTSPVPAPPPSSSQRTDDPAYGRVSNEYLVSTLRQLERTDALDSQLISAAFLRMLCSEIVDRRATSSPPLADLREAVRLLHIVHAWYWRAGDEPDSARADPLYPSRGVSSNRAPLFSAVRALLERYPYGGSAPTKEARPHRIDKFGDCINPGCTYPSVGNLDKNNCTGKGESSSHE